MEQLVNKFVEIFFIFINFSDSSYIILNLVIFELFKSEKHLNYV